MTTVSELTDERYKQIDSIVDQTILDKFIQSTECIENDLLDKKIESFEIYKYLLTIMLNQCQICQNNYIIFTTQIKTNVMKVKELIEKLSQFNPETEVRIEMTDPTDFRYVNEVDDVELGEKDYDDYSDDDFELDEDGEIDYDLLKESSKVVIINGGNC